MCNCNLCVWVLSGSVSFVCVCVYVCEREEEVVAERFCEREKERKRERVIWEVQVFCYIKPGYEFENRISKYKALGACAGVDCVNCGLLYFFLYED